MLKLFLNVCWCYCLLFSLNLPFFGALPSFGTPTSHPHHPLSCLLCVPNLLWTPNYAKGTRYKQQGKSTMKCSYSERSNSVTYFSYVCFPSKKTYPSSLLLLGFGIHLLLGLCSHASSLSAPPLSGLCVSFKYAMLYCCVSARKDVMKAKGK